MGPYYLVNKDSESGRCNSILLSCGVASQNIPAWAGCLRFHLDNIPGPPGEEVLIVVVTVWSQVQRPMTQLQIQVCLDATRCPCVRAFGPS